MELHIQIKKYRTNMNLSQEELAEKIHVTRQTISNWENNKNYPDIHSLLLLSSLFNLSLDQLIKGDIDIMREEINKADFQKFNRYSVIFSFLLILCVVSAAPLAIFLGYLGISIFAALFIITMYFALKLEKYKKKHDIQTFKEISSFMEGHRLDEIEKAQEHGKRPYQKIIFACTSGIISFVVSIIFVWLIKSFIFL